MSAAGLSRRRVRAMVAVGQRWVDDWGRVFTVRQIHRKDGLVALEGPGRQPRYVRFGELGRRYSPEEER